MVYLRRHRNKPNALKVVRVGATRAKFVHPLLGYCGELTRDYHSTSERDLACERATIGELLGTARATEIPAREELALLALNKMVSEGSNLSTTRVQ